MSSSIPNHVITPISARQLACLTVLSLSVGAAMLVWARGASRYDAPHYGGPEPAETQRGATEILATGRTDMTYHPTGYSYVVAAAYVFLPDSPVSMLWIQVASLPVLVWAIQSIATFLAGQRARNWAIAAGCLYYPFGYYAGTFNNVYATMLFLTLGVAWFLPLTRGTRSLGRALAVGFALGVAACCRGNFAVLGVFYFLQLWRSHRNPIEALVRSMPTAVVSIAMLATMIYLNPPESGQFMRGGQAFNRSILQGTYQYAHQWWDWEWYGNVDEPGGRELTEHIKRIEAESKHPITDRKSQEIVKREAWKRVLEYPTNTFKKILISSVRVWILIPTHVKSMPFKIACAVQEFVLLMLALAGLVWVFRNRSEWIVLLGVMLIPTVFHWLLHTEPRYSVPAKGVELALAVIAVVALVHKKIIDAKNCDNEVVTTSKSS